MKNQNQLVCSPEIKEVLLKLEAEVNRLRQGIKDYLEGDITFKDCPHCTHNHFSKLLEG